MMIDLMEKNKNSLKFFFKNQVLHFGILFLGLYYFYVFEIDHSKSSFLGLNSYQWLITYIWIHIFHMAYVWVCWRSELLWKSISKLIGFNGYIIGFFILILSRLFSLIIPFLDYGTLYKPNFISYLVSAVLFMPIIYTFYSVKKFFGFKRAAGLDHFDQSYKNIPFEKRGIFKWFPNSMYMFGLLMPFTVAVLTGSKIMFIVGVYTYIGGWIHYFATEKPDINYIYKNKHEL